MPKIKVKIKKNGKVEFKVEGMTGSSCQQLTKPLEEALGKTVEDKKTQEYYQTNTNVQKASN